MYERARFAALGVAICAFALSTVVCGRALAEPVGSAQATSNPACDRAAFRLVLDVGHTAKAFGATSARGEREFDFNLRLAKVIERKLREGGFEKTLLLVTEGRSGRGLGLRVARANKAGGDLFLSIHHDSVPDKFLEKWEFEGRQRTFSDRFKGHSIFVSHQNGSFATSVEFGRLLGQQLKTHGLRYTPHYVEKFMGHRQRQLVDADAGVYRYDQLIVLKDTRMPAVLLEAGSIINRDEELAMETPQRQGLIAASVFEAVDRFCAARRPQASERVAHQPERASDPKRTVAPAALASPMLARPR